ncbi:hypothetical protein [Rhodobium gokarnense]|uniref:Uncharacterized protein n=1 Tax=Rhodobium gokarnense TaxID=364296 RepID=A0ABT3H8N7_9HYPH|nr:hypothetical protein [Rhodobium gokarnense]MCW2306767.1 hypothetical protein [Rhodobium gokarnense]
MRIVWKLAYLALKIASIAALILVVAGIGSLVAVTMLDACPTLNEGAIRCTSGTAQGFAEFGMTVLLLTVFTGIPGLLAVIGLGFLVRDLMRWRRRQM